MGSEDVKIEVFWICDVSTIDIKDIMNPDDKPVLRNHFAVKPGQAFPSLAN